MGAIRNLVRRRRRRCSLGVCKVTIYQDSPVSFFINSTTVSVTIHVIDENDNAPKFKNDTFSFYLPENEPPDSYVGRLTATDRDIGRNAELTFSIATSQNDFTIDPKSGFIKTLRYFDRERLLQTSGQDYVVLEAIVTDNGVSRLRDRARIHVYIMGTFSTIWFVL